MRIVSLLVAFLSLSLASAQEANPSNPQAEPGVPTTLAEAHAALERMLSPGTLAEIDAMASEDGMAKYHFAVGLNIRNGWGLWAGSALAKHMRELGFTHPDDMSGVILGTFWCKRHGKPFRLEERAAAAKEWANAAKKAEEEKEDRIRESNEIIRDRMMGLRFEKRDVPVVQIPLQNGMNVRFLCPFRNGVFLTAYCQGSVSSHQHIATDGHCVDPVSGEPCRRPDMDDSVRRGYCSDRTAKEPRKMKPGEDVYTVGFHFDLTDRKVRLIRVPEVNDIYSVAVVGKRAWFAGMTDGKPVLVGVGQSDRVTAPAMPQEDEIPDLGMDGQLLLAVYSKTIYRLEDRQWKLVHSGDILLPRSGLPPQRHGDRVFLRDEGVGECRKRFWWLDMGAKPHLRLFARDAGLFEPVVQRNAQGVPEMTHSISPYDWDDATSYCVTESGDLWFCVAGGSFLLRRSAEGDYSIAIAYNSPQFTESRPDARPAAPQLSVSAIAPAPDGGFLLAGNTGLYRLRGNDLIQELAFTALTTSGNRGKANPASWTPNCVLSLDDRSYVIGTTMWDGVYLLRKGDDGQWRCLPAERTRDTVVW